MRTMKIRKIRMENLIITVVIEPDDGEFHAYCPAFKGLHINGETELETLQRTKEALGVYIESLRRYDDPLPIGEHCQMTQRYSIMEPRHEGQAAHALARVAHAGQKDKQGRDYILHPQRVASAIEFIGDQYEAIGWLHDTFEDTAVDLSTLSSLGFSSLVAITVTTLTRNKEDTYKEYIQKIKESGSDAAMLAKIADLYDHLSNLYDGMKESHIERYQEALDTLINNPDHSIDKDCVAIIRSYFSEDEEWQRV